MKGGMYLSDSEVAFDNMLAYAATVEVGSDGNDAWIFDVDETIISNLPFYKRYGYGNTTETNDTASVFKSRRREELVKEGYKLHGCSGDQWSDLVGYPMARRIFKVPNPMYYVA
ncbi:hypothetical protein K2173_005316 [Erythroxylum novogranatense]|uniref:Acid phosphatase n=1 Tax=Erythroxylum novogranatense TaxID=1862640 RepID=A0AAV8TIN1_9ROSI|nr:hypothetical protein K2173_005316 [Erythroxylum novogranatense]